MKRHSFAMKAQTTIESSKADRSVCYLTLLHNTGSGLSCENAFRLFRLSWEAVADLSPKKKKKDEFRIRRSRGRRNKA